MLLIAAGLPIALLVFFGNPVPKVPKGSSLADTVASSDFVLHVIVCIVWLAWAQFTACLLAELVAGVRGSGLPRRIPLAGAQQDVARRLITAVLLLATASQGLHSAPRPSGGTASAAPGQIVQVVSPGTAGDSGTQSHVPHSAPVSVAPGGHGPSAPSAPARGHATHRQVTKEYIVMPPDGRHHDSLWDIADRYLGSGIRYKEIFHLNEGRVQPDGERLTLESLIRPGWTLILPADAHGAGLIEVTNAPGPHATVTVPGAPTMPAPASRAHTHAAPGQSTDTRAAGDQQHSGGQARTGSDQGTGSDHRTGQVPVLGGDQGSGRHSSTDAPGAQSGSEAAPAERAPDIPWDIVGAELLAAGVLEALIAMRRRRSRGRRAGAPVPALDPDGAAAEVGIRLGADPGSAAFLDGALRTLAAGLGEHDRPVPEIFAARLTAERLELHLAVPARQAPAPFTAENDGAIWVLPRSVPLAPPSDVVAPLPGLVSIGGDGSGRVFVDLESAGGPISVAGDLNAARSVVAAAAVELVTNRWSDGMRVTLVGFGNALAPISPDRLRCVGSLGEVIDELTDRLSEATRAMGAAGLDSVLTGRVRGGRGTPYPPEFVVLAAPPEPDQLATLQAWAAASRRAPLGVLVAGEVAGARWQFTIGNDGVLDTGVLGMTVGAQQLSARSYAGLARLLQAEAAASRLATAPAPVSIGVTRPAAPIAAPHIPRPVDPAAARVLVRIFGEPTVTADELPPATPLAAEIVTYLALVGEVSPRGLAAAIWPYGVTQAERDAAIDRAREWLGVAGDGAPRLRETEGGRLRLAEDVQLDWHQFVTLAGRGDDHQTLAALELVRGPLATPHQPRRYTWLVREPVSRELPAYVVDVAHRLAESYLAAGQFDGAAAASRAGLRAEPDSAVLWDDLTTAVERRDGPAAVQLVWAERSAALGPESLPDAARLSA